MIELVYRPSRMVGGRRVIARLYRGRFRLDGDRAITEVALQTPDRRIAEKRLRDIILEKQREKEGLIAPAAIRNAASTQIAELLQGYKTDLGAQRRVAQHVKDSTRRIARIIKECGWKQLSDINADQFVAWRGTLVCSAKTAKEYQISLNAFLNWLVRAERLLRNPLAKLNHIKTRGKMVREARSFSVDELQRLFSVCGPRKIVYQFLAYTGLRKEEARLLCRPSVQLQAEIPHVILEAEETKDTERRVIPLHGDLANALKEFVACKSGGPRNRLFHGVFPNYDTLRRDLERANIAHRSENGRVVHFHSFRKTFQTLGVVSGVNQRAAQELLGHTDANLTAKAYTDVAALKLVDEIQKLPWIGNSQPTEPPGTDKGERSSTASFPGIPDRQITAPGALPQRKGLIETVGFDQGRECFGQGGLPDEQAYWRICREYFDQYLRLSTGAAARLQDLTNVIAGWRHLKPAFQDAIVAIVLERDNRRTA